MGISLLGNLSVMIGVMLKLGTVIALGKRTSEITQKSLPCDCFIIYRPETASGKSQLN